MRGIVLDQPVAPLGAQRATKELKVHIPTKYVMMLHEAKIKEGKQIAVVVQKALEEYFAHLKER